MKKIDFKFSKRQALLFAALIALTSFVAWSANTLSSSEPQASVDSLKRVTEHVSDVPSSVEPEIADNTAVNVAPTHANKTGVNGTTTAEENSFMRLHLTYGISFEPWSTVL